MNKYLFFIIFILVSHGALAESEFRSCGRGDHPWRDINVTYHYDGPGNQASFTSITPQGHAVIQPSIRVALRIESKKCLEYRLIVKDPSGQEVQSLSAKPFSPRRDCILPPGSNYPPHWKTELENGEHFTDFIFTTPSNPGEYSLEIYGDKEKPLTTGTINVLDPSMKSSNEVRKSWCQLRGQEHVITLETPYPAVFETDDPAVVSVEVAGPYAQASLFERINISLTPFKADRVDLTKLGQASCSNSVCKQDYAITASQSTSAIIYVLQGRAESNSRYGISSSGITLLDVGKLKQMVAKAQDAHESALKNAQFYKKQQNLEKSKHWDSVAEKIKSLIISLEEAVVLANKKDLTLSDTVNLVNILKDAKEEIDAVISSA